MVLSTIFCLIGLFIDHFFKKYNLKVVLFEIIAYICAQKEVNYDL